VVSLVNFDLANSIVILKRTPAVLSELLGGLPTVWTAPNEGPDTWSPFDVVGHLIDGEETDWIPRARVILLQGPNRRFEPFDRFLHMSLNRGRSLGELLNRFAEVRHRNLVELEEWNLGPDQLRLQGEHPEFGPVTLAQLLATWVVHDLGHLAQITRVMAKQYRDAVGPWAAYLPVIQR
jgi:hypothetical protein